MAKAMPYGTISKYQIQIRMKHRNYILSVEHFSLGSVVYYVNK